MGEDRRRRQRGGGGVTEEIKLRQALDDAVVREGKVLILLEEIRGVLVDSCQLFDGRHVNTQWTEWDQSVRDRASEALRKVHEVIDDVPIF